MVAPVAPSVAAAAAPVPRKRLGKREKAQLRADSGSAPNQQQSVDSASAKPEAVVDVSTPVWPWHPLSERASAVCPVVFSSDCSYCFIASGSSVKVYSVSSTQLLSTLTAPASVADQSSGSVRRTKVSSVLLNPSNPHQLIIGSLDGMLRMWDYREGRLLRTLDLGSGVQHACGHPSLPDQLFVALHQTQDAAAKADKTKEKIEEGDEIKSGVYSISLRPKALAPGERSAGPTAPRTPARRVRLAHPRVVRALNVSPTGAFLISVNPTTINVAKTAHLQAGFSQQLESPERLTTLAFHPVENYFATGNEKGQIRLWYDVLDAKPVEGEEMEEDKAVVKAKKNAPATAIFHWHAHAVSALSFTPNGAYLLSGGEESVLVLWQLHTGHKEFVPRLGAPVLTLSITNGANSEQQIAARLRDGSVVFVGTQKLKVSRTIAGLKADPVRLNDYAKKSFATSTARVPLAVQPISKNLVLPAGHPSSIQFYSPAEDAQTLELEVSPSNRVSSAGSAPIEPTRVDMVAFSTPVKAGKKAGEYWMATLDSWSNGTFTPSRHLKFWYKTNAPNSSFVLSTRIDRPHDAPITSVSFSPNTENPLLLTTSTDGSIKIWALVDDGWQCRTSIAYRSFTPIDAAWSQDGSMFAVAHSRSVTLWELASASLIHAFPCSAIAPARSVEFTNKEGTALLAGGEHGTMVWDLLTFEETFNLAFEVNDITPKPNSSLFIATEKSASSKAQREGDEGPAAASQAFLVDSSKPTCEPRPLPFPVRQSLWLESGPNAKEDSVSLAVVDERGEVSLVGQIASVGQEVAPSRLPAELSTGHSRLFDDIFGKEAEKKKVKETAVQQVTQAPRASTSAALEVLDSPAHSLPPVRLLWRSMLGDFALPGVGQKKAKKVEGGQKVPSYGGEDVEMEVEEDEQKVEQDGAEVDYTPSPAALADIFKQSLALSASKPKKEVNGVGLGTPKGGKGGKGATPSRSSSRTKA